jgi:serine/threonine protein kinase
MDATDKLKRYQVMAPLGSGSQGRTFRAIDRETSREVAVKVLALRRIEDWKEFDLFEREIAVLRSLDHPGIPKYVDNYASEKTGEYFLVMDLAPGLTLAQRMAQERPLSEKEVRRVLECMLDVLEYLHARVPPVIHRDIKPANILLGQGGRVSLVDFGGVRLALHPAGGSTMIGTLGYMAPEQLHGAATPATDIFALGATIASLHAGLEADKLPRDGLRIDLEAVMPPSALRNALVRMIDPDPTSRLVSVAEVRRALADGGRAAPPGAAGPSAEPSDAIATTEEDEDATAFDVTEEVAQLAQVPAPFSILVWVWAALMTGALAVAEAVILPVVFLVMRSSRANKRRFGPGQLERHQRRYRRTLRRHRRALQEVADRTAPSADKPRKKLPPSDDRPTPH